MNEKKKSCKINNEEQDLKILAWDRALCNYIWEGKRHFRNRIMLILGKAFLMSCL